MVIVSDRYLFLVYAVLNLGSTDEVFLTRICLRKPHLQHHSPGKFVFQGLSVSIALISERYLFLVNAVLNLSSTDDAFLTCICLRKSHLEHHSPSFVPKTYTSIHAAPRQGPPAPRSQSVTCSSGFVWSVTCVVNVSVCKAYEMFDVDGIEVHIGYILVRRCSLTPVQPSSHWKNINHQNWKCSQWLTIPLNEYKKRWN